MKHYFEQPETVLQAQGSGTDGLSSSVTEERLLQNGKNKLAEAKHKSIFVRFFEQIKDPMIIVLIAAAIISGAFGEIADMAIILVVVVLNSVLGVFQESKAEKAIEALQKMSAPHTRVRRDGTVCVINSEDVVVGDIVLLEAGDSIPADMRVIESASLKVEEAALTGESVAVDKTSAVLKAEKDEIPLGDRVNMAYMGTNVVYGRGEGVVIATGMDTEMGKIAGILTETGEEKTPLQKKLASLSKVLSAVVLGICVFIFLFSILRNGGFGGGHVFETFMTAVSLAVAAIPEGLVVVVTVLLSIGVTKMSKRNSIIRRLTAVETLGCTQVICSDKTGTLTQNKMTVVDHFGDERLLAESMFFCNDVEAGTDGELVGDPTQLAQKEFGLRWGTFPDRPRLGEIPFDSERKMMTTLHESDDGYCQYTTGAPDEVLKKCTGILTNGEIRPLTSADREQVLTENKRMADKALRVLGGAFRQHGKYPEDQSPDTLERDMIFVGLIGMIDPIRPEVKAAIDECKSAGIRAIMITGDHKDTAVAIAKDLGILKDASEAITGAELAKMPDDEFDMAIDRISVYARVQPEHKVRIVNTWRKKGKITAMTGDGVNDAPALKSADIGVGMGITGTDVTKNVSDMVLADDNFASIVYAVEEGRRIYENIRKAIQFLLASNLSEVIAVFIAMMFNTRIFAPIHILWINLITDTFPAMALGMEEAEADSMKQPPRDSKEGIFASGLGMGVIYQGILIAALTLISFFIGNAQSHAIGMTMAFLTLSMCELFHSLNMRSRTKSIFSMKGHNKHLIGSMLMCFALTIAVIYIPGLNTVFKLTALVGGNFFAAFGLAIAIIPIVELVKAIQRNTTRKNKTVCLESQ